MKFHDVEQGSPEWLAARCGILTASEMKLILTPALKIASNDKERTHLYELLAQRITGHVEPHYVSDEMLRGHDDEITARELYAKHYAPVKQVGFVTDDRWGFTIGYSPDGLVGKYGLIECKSRRQKYQVQGMIEHVAAGQIPDEHVLQVQTGLLVTNRNWCDYISFSGGLPMTTVRVRPDLKIQAAIIAAATAFEARLFEARVKYDNVVAQEKFRTIPTERTIYGDIML